MHQRLLILFFITLSIPVLAQTSNISDTKRTKEITISTRDTNFNSVGLAWMQTDSKFGVIDTLGNVILPPLYETILFANDSIIILKHRGFFGMTNKQRSFNISAEFDKIQQLNNI